MHPFWQIITFFQKHFFCNLWIGIVKLQISGLCWALCFYCEYNSHFVYTYTTCHVIQSSLIVVNCGNYLARFWWCNVAPCSCEARCFVPLYVPTCIGIYSGTKHVPHRTQCYINTGIQQWSKKEHYKPIHNWPNVRFWLTILHINVTLYIDKKKKKNYTNCRNASNEYCTCAERNIVSQAAGWWTV